MEQQSEAARVDQELQQARHDLRETLEQFNHKVEQVEARLRPRAIVRSNPVVLPLLAGALGFFLGRDHEPRPLRWILIGALVGTALLAAGRGSDGTNE